jgi:hypothetical protein
MAREHIEIPLADTSATMEALERVRQQIADLRKKLEQITGVHKSPPVETVIDSNERCE